MVKYPIVSVNTLDISYIGYNVNEINVTYAYKYICIYIYIYIYIYIELYTHILAVESERPIYFRVANRFAFCYRGN